MDFSDLFPRHSCIWALPNFRSPRLLVDGKSIQQRWKQSAAYPAYRLPAKIFRVFLRIKTAVFFGSFCRTSSAHWAVGDYLEGVISEVRSMGVLLGTPGPSQKYIIQLWDAEQIIAYLKYAERPAAKHLLQEETNVLLSLPTDLGPRVLKYGPLEHGMGLLMTPIVGRHVPAKLPPLTSIPNFLSRLSSHELLTIDQHPWVISHIKKFGDTDIAPLITMLNSRKWSVTITHGDFAPWNLLRNTENQILALDWEYGDRKGFPGLDLAHYILQVAKLIYRWKPHRAFLYTVDYLRSYTCLELTLSEAKAITRITGYLLFLRARTEGHVEHSHVQQWNKAIWGGLL